VIVGARLTQGEGFTIAKASCHGASRNFEAPEQETGHVLVTIDRGAFLRRTGPQETLVDSTVAYLSAPGIVEQFAHPVGDGDVCTVIHLSRSLTADLTGGDPFLSEPALPMDAHSELAVRRLEVLAQGGDTAGVVAEHLVRLVAAIVGRRYPERIASGRPATTLARKRIVDQARAAMHADPSIGLVAIARDVACSPHHLSRVFANLTGCTFSQYRNRLRVSRALAEISQGEQNLGRIAAEVGFSDHAHLARTIRALTGHTPSACRSIIGPTFRSTS
jgi:AraC-like DNA-binding protein